MNVLRETTMAQCEAVGREMVTERGMQALRMGQVAERAGISRASLYRYYESKEVFLRCVVISALREDFDPDLVHTDNREQIVEMFIDLCNALTGPVCEAAREATATETLNATLFNNEFVEVVVEIMRRRIDPQRSLHVVQAAVMYALFFWAFRDAPFLSADGARLWARKHLPEVEA